MAVHFATARLVRLQRIYWPVAWKVSPHARVSLDCPGIPSFLQEE